MERRVKNEEEIRMKKGLNRRNLFKYMGAGGVTAVIAGCEKKPEKLIELSFNYEDNHEKRSVQIKGLYL